MKLSFKKKIEIARPVKNLKIQDVGTRQFLLDQPFIQEYIKRKEQQRFEEGVQEGKRVQEEEMRSVINSAAEAFQQAVLSVEEGKKDLIRELEPQIINFCLKAVEMIVGREIDAASANLEKLIKPILTKVSDATRIIVKVNPQDLNQLREFSSDIVDDGKIESLEIVSDADISLGGCIVETDVGTIDATLETRIEQMKEAVQGGREVPKHSEDPAALQDENPATQVDDLAPQVDDLATQGDDPATQGNPAESADGDGEQKMEPGHEHEH